MTQTRPDPQIPNDGGDMTAEQFIGTWKLVSTDYRDMNGSQRYPYGENPVGMLIYDADGHMAVQIMRRDRPAIAAIEETSLEQIQLAFGGYTACFGTYDVNEQEGSVIHHLEACLLPWYGGDQKTYFEFTGNRLTLRPHAPRTIGGVVLSGSLVWARVSRVDDGQVAVFQDSGEPETVIWTLGHYNKRTQFSYDGNVNVGVTLRFKANLFISAQFFHSILEHFTGKTVEGGFSMTNSPRDGYGYWVAENSSKLNGIRLTPRHASFIAAILAHEGFITSSLDGNAVILHFPSAD
jgi:hypothetical protein